MDLLDDWLTDITRWITRFYGDQEGLAAIDASEDDEDTWTPRDGWKVAAHHGQAPEAYSLDREGRSWELLAISTVLRDRWFLPSMRNIANP